jgi:signal transduction histidine kinase/CheY-like chemotaxis protein/AraC-like DNA-binding protein
MWKVVVCFIFLLIGPLVSAQEAYVLESQYPVHDLQPQLQVVADTNEVYTPEIILKDSTIRFTTGDELPRRLEVGLTYWGTFQMIIKDSIAGWTLQFEDRRIGPPAWVKSNGKVDVYVFQGDNQVAQRKTGVEYSKTARDNQENWVLNQVSLDELPLNTPLTFIIKIRGNSLGYPAYFNLSARSPEQAGYHKIFSFHNSYNLFLFGVTFIIFLYHVLQFFYLRQRVFFWFSIWVLFCTLIQGMTIGLIIGQVTQYRFSIWLLISNSIWYSFWFFGRAFIDSKRKFPKLDKAILALAFSVIAETLLILFYEMIFSPQIRYLSVWPHFQFLQLYTIGSLILSIILLFKRDPFARYFGVGSLIGSGALAIGALWSRGVISVPIDPYATSILLQIIIYSFGIAFRQQVLSKNIERERMEAQKTIAEIERIKDLDEIKARFFANISHEFRTPLSLITGHLRHARTKAQLAGHPAFIAIDQRAHNVITKNANRLNTLVEQLLELSKLESGNIHLSLKQGGLLAFVRSIIFSFESYAEENNISLNTYFSPDNPEAYYDKDKLEKILTNLLSNAIKYTSDRGSVTVVIDINSDYLYIEVTDTGKGIDKTEIKYIFERFYRVEGSEEKGSGIGLSLTKELVELHNGTIVVESIKGEGSTFRVKLPISSNHLPQAISTDNGVDSQLIVPKEIVPSTFDAPAKPKILAKNAKGTLPIILIIEDNEDLRLFISEIIGHKYQVLTAEDGLKGERMAFEHIPDLIITDVMMPQKDGYQLCHSVKNNPKTSHIPIIMLTAKAGHGSKLEGLMQGADSYLTKPFDEEELLIRIKNLIDARERLWEHFKSLDMFLTDELEVKSIEDHFLQDLFQTIKENLGNDQFGVDDLVRKVGFSRSQLHRKLKALLGKSANQIIIEVRLNEAYRMLKQNSGSVSEIAYSVGYSNLSYFTKSFKNKFGVLPSRV